jgi:RNA polymerase sigma factor for flagellar operon FliA
MAVSDRLAMYGSAQGNSSAQLVERYSPLVKRIAHHLLARLPSSVQVDDLIQSGLIGLLEAARNYDATKGAAFETYAGIRIRGSMIDEVRRGDWVPRSVHRNTRRIQETMIRLQKSLGREANDQEMAAELGISIPEYHTMAQDSLCSRLFSLDELSGDDERPNDFVPSDAPSPAEGAQRDALRHHLASAIGALPERERLVMALYYDEELNLKEIGLVLGVSESRVSQIHSQATLRLRTKMTDWEARDILE